MFPIEKYIDQIKLLCEKYKVKKLFIFGSALTNNFKASSDIDFLYVMKKSDPIDMGNNILDLYIDLESALGRKIDLVSYNSIRNAYFKESVEKSKVLIYNA